MTILTSVRLRNWRGIHDITFKPLEQGLTGVSGANGAGKSSIQEGVIWALFGVTPDDAKKEDLRRSKSALSDECSVSVVFVHKGQTIEVIRQLSGKNHTTTMYVYVDGREQTHTTPTAANQWIIDRLGMDAEGFLTAHIVKQKQLDSLMNARAAERRSLIEKFFGVEKMSEALKLARSEANDAKKVAAALPGTPEEVEEAEVKLTGSLEMVESEQFNIQYVEQTLLRAETDLEQAEKGLNVLLGAQNTYSSAQTQVERADHAVQVHTERSASTQQLLTEARLRAVGSDDKSYKSLVKQSETLTTALATTRQKQDVFRSEKATVEAQVSSLEEQNLRISLNLERACSQRDAIVAKIKALPKSDKKDYPKQVDVLNAELLDLNSQLRDFEGRQVRLVKSIATLQEHTESANCPTCHSHLNNPSELVEVFEGEIADLKARATETSRVISQKRDTKTALEEKSALQQRSIIEKESLQADLARAESSISEVGVESKQISQALEKAQSSLSALLDNMDSDAITSEIGQLEEGLNKVRVDLARQTEAKEAAESVRRYETQLDELRKKIEDSEYDASLAEEALAALEAPTADEISQAEELVLNRKSTASNKREALSAARGDLRAAQARVDAAKENVDSQKRLLERKSKALSQSEEKAAVAEVLEEFRRDRISRIAPELSEATTALISSVTDGYYTEVNLDENFTPTLVKANGDMVPAQWLSGGEKSVVSLALRVAIGDIMTGGNAGLLWLDEVLVSQDAERRQAMMGAIRDLDRQVVVVNHTQGSDDLVDTLVTVIKDDENGSRLEES